ncbi:hypothetical protein F5878DRAFT_667268 [Lentinula raphanica]|uniref:Uncharacterized protein n=1 Tax=Lentinula raphanica TaxID=153919 RepID=A0AA38NW40_9AGAR|nr:hypothetical protein F5880DRAFT_1611329 [Lentinula raphanica]KAJ3831716.1 hypothetical protein F5878DRAFT_667268 [Lentinula raphanica]
MVTTAVTPTSTPTLALTSTPMSIPTSTPTLTPTLTSTLTPTLTSTLTPTLTPMSTFPFTSTSTPSSNPNQNPSKQSLVTIAIAAGLGTGLGTFTLLGIGLYIRWQHLSHSKSESAGPTETDNSHHPLDNGNNSLPSHPGLMNTASGYEIMVSQLQHLLAAQDLPPMYDDQRSIGVEVGTLERLDVNESILLHDQEKSRKVKLT